MPAIERPPERGVDKSVLKAFLDHEIDALSHDLGPVISYAYHGNRTPYPDNRRPGYYESLLYADINRPSIVGDSVSDPLAVSLEQQGLAVFTADLPFDHLGLYDGGSIAYRPELRGVLRASVLGHEAAHHFAGHTPGKSREDGQEAIAESAAMIALRFFGINTEEVSLPDI